MYHILSHVSHISHKQDIGGEKCVKKDDGSITFPLQTSLLLGRTITCVYSKMNSLEMQH